MNKKIAVIISPNWNDYAEKYLADFIESLRKQDYKDGFKVFLTDNESSAKSYEFLSKTAPEAELVLNNTNDGYAKGCNDSIRLALSQGFDYFAIFNIHTVLEPNCLTEMFGAFTSDKKIGAVQALMMLYDNKNKISSLGNSTHFLGFGYCEGYNESIDKFSNIKEKNIFYPSGSSIFTSREVLEDVGLFDEVYWMYNEDQDLGWRIWLSGRKCVLASKAKMYNKYEFSRSIKKYYWMDRNRILAILQSYHFLTLLLIFPAFVFMEFGLLLFAIKGGWIKEKIKVWAWFFSLKNWFYIFRKRKQNQDLRRVKERKIAKMISGRIWYQEVDDWKLHLVNPFFDLYWKFIQKIIFW